MSYTREEQALQAVGVLNNLIGDIITGEKSHGIWETIFNNRPATPEDVRAAVFRMHITQLVLALTRTRELWLNYSNIVPGELHKEFVAIVQRIEKSGAVKFRNKFVGHIMDNDTNRPLNGAEIDQRFNKVIDGNFDEFLIWMNQQSDPERKSVAQFLERVRDGLISQYGLIVGADGRVGLPNGSS